MDATHERVGTLVAGSGFGLSLEPSLSCNNAVQETACVEQCLQCLSQL